MNGIDILWALLTLLSVILFISGDGWRSEKYACSIMFCLR